MPEQTIEINKDELTSTVNLLEEEGPLKNITELYTLVANSLNTTPSIVKTRMENWKIPTKTKKPQRKSYDIPEIPENTIIRQRIVFTPAIRCPIELSSWDQDAVLSWAKDVKAKGIQIGQVYTKEAIAYFAREFFDANSPEFAKIKLFIRQMFLEEESLQQSSHHLE